MCLINTDFQISELISLQPEQGGDWEKKRENEYRELWVLRLWTPAVPSEVGSIHYQSFYIDFLRNIYGDAGRKDEQDK